MNAWNIQITDIYREANYLADNTANIAFQSVIKQQFWGFGDLPSSAIRLVNIDK